MCSITLLARSPWFLSATFATLTTFNQQKHGIHNEKVGHGRSRHSLLCPVHTLANPVITMHWQHASFETPLDTVCADHSAPWSYSPLSSLLLPDSKPHCISISIRQTFWHTFPESAPPAPAVPWQSRCARGRQHQICLLGRWRSDEDDEYDRYLHV